MMLNLDRFDKHLAELDASLKESNRKLQQIIDLLTLQVAMEQEGQGGERGEREVQDS